MLPPKWDSFPNKNDAMCAWALWAILALVFLCYVVVSTMSYVDGLYLPEDEDVFSAELQLPPVWLQLCDLLPLQAALNYSLLDHLIVQGRLNYVMPNGTEILSHMPFNTSAAAVYKRQNFHCKRFAITSKVPMEAIMPYFIFFVGIQEPFHPKLSEYEGFYSKGLFFGPSLAHDPVNDFASKEENLVKTWVPSTRLPGQRNVVLNAVPSRAMWIDSMGGRQGAPCDDTFFFADVSMVADAITQPEDARRYTNASINSRPTLRLVVPVAHQEVITWSFKNDILADTLAWLGKLASATVIFKLLTAVFPSARQKRYHLLMHLPCLGLGTEEEDEPLLKREGDP
mmetsp:Transcript_98670/g.235050  ORF Transcript_98670/g.235050 Transcript_98670/m.235050 type:complete len:341 (-) Transcript_98670:120-1142(-)